MQAFWDAESESEVHLILGQRVYINVFSAFLYQ